MQCFWRKMQSHIFSFKKSQLPQEFQYHHIAPENDDEEYTLRANLKTRKDITQWIRKFGAATLTQWNVKRTREGPTKLSIEFVCHRSSFMKVPKDEKGCNKRGISKNASCLARIRISTNVAGYKRSSDQFARIGLWAKIRISKEHTHALDTVEALRFLQSKDGTFRETFFEYFSDNMTAAEAKHFHEHKLTLKNATEADFANGYVNPTGDTVRYWFCQWRMLNLAPRSASELISKLNQKKTLYAEKNIILEFKEEPFCVLLSTPLMQSAHSLPSSKELLFIDSTTVSDSGRHSVTLLLTTCAAGVVPLAVIITSGQTTKAYSEGFRLTNTIPGCFGKQGFPKIIFTCNSAEEIAACEENWPEATSLLCTFRVLQAVWRWLWDSENSIKTNDRAVLMDSFKAILQSKNMIEMETAYNRCVETGTNLKYTKWIKYVKNYYKFKERWVLAYRDQSVRYHHTNNFNETSIRIFKDIVLSRVKAYNVITLLDFCATSLEEYYVTKLKNFSTFQNRESFSFFRENLKKVSYLNEDDIVRDEDRKLLFFVPSEKDNSIRYTVDCEVGSCTCNEGKYGKFCKHQCAVYQYFEINSDNFPPISTKDRYLTAKIALGVDATPNVAFYEELEESPPNTPECVEMSPSCSPSRSPESPQSSSVAPIPLKNITNRNAKSSKSLHSLDDEKMKLFRCIMNKFEENLHKYSSSVDIIAGLEKFSKTMDNISTEETFLQFLHTTPKALCRLQEPKQ